MIRLPKWLGVALALAMLALWTSVAIGDTAKDEQTATGKVKSVSAKHNQVVLTVKDRDWTFQVADSAKIRVGDKEARLADLKAGDEVTVTYRMEARAVRSDEGMHAHGRIKSISADKHQVVVRDERGKEHTFNLNKDSRIRLADKEARLADLKEGDEVGINYTKSGGELTARRISKHGREQAMRHTHGEVKSVAAATNRLVLKDAGGQERTFNLAADAKVRLGDRDGKLADLKEGDKIDVAYQARATDIRSKARE
jgi:Cu/Ag efflux protein CusF